MHIELGTGHKNIVYYNADGSHDIDVLLARIAAAYKAMLSVGYPSVTKVNGSCRLIFTSESPVCAGLRIHVSLRPCGIYTDKSAYHRQIAHAFYTMTCLDMYARDCADAAVEIGVGGIDVGTQGYVMLKDAVLGLANYTASDGVLSRRVDSIKG